MATQMSSARRGIATDEMKQVAKDEDVTLDWLLPKIAIGSIIIPSNNVRPQKIHNVGIGKGMKTKVNVNIGTLAYFRVFFQRKSLLFFFGEISLTRTGFYQHLETKSSSIFFWVFRRTNLSDVVFRFIKF